MVVAQGQKIAYKDSKGKEIRVGDLLKTGKGEYWDINSYLQAVPRHAAVALDVKQFFAQFPWCSVVSKEESNTIGRVLGVQERVKKEKSPKTQMRERVKNMCVTEGFKVCLHCGELKEVKEFSRCSRSSDGLQSWCKKCTNNYYKEKGTTRRKYKKQ